MRAARVALALFVVSFAHAAAQEATPDRSTAYRTFRYDEDYGFLRDPARRADPFDPLKYIPLDRGGDLYLTLGGEARLRYEYVSNPTFGQDAQDDAGAVLQRYVLAGDLHLGRRVRLFAELSSALENGREGGPGPVDENELTFQNAFADVVPFAGEDLTLTLRGGRQELQFGSGRIVSVRNGPNVRRTFDGGRVILSGGEWRADALLARPRDDRPGVFDDETSDEQTLWGLYAVGRPDLLPAGAVDLYYLGFRDEAAVFDQGAADETRHSLGVRLAGASGPLDWNWEALFQFGSFGDGDIRAWTLATDTGWTFEELPWRPRLAFNANVASGDDDPDDPDLQTFNPLFPRGSYFSEAAVLGPRNFFNLHPFLTVHPSSGWSVTADLDLFWRLETEDGLYSPSGRLIRAGGSDERFVGTALSLTSSLDLGAHTSLTAIYTHFVPGDFIRATGPDDPIDFVELTLGFRF